MIYMWALDCTGYFCMATFIRRGKIILFWRINSSISANNPVTIEDNLLSSEPISVPDVPACPAADSLMPHIQRIWMCRIFTYISALPLQRRCRRGAFSVYISCQTLRSPQHEESAHEASLGQCGAETLVACCIIENVLSSISLILFSF